MKYTIPSLVIIGLIIWGGVSFFGGNKEVASVPISTDSAIPNPPTDAGGIPSDQTATALLSDKTVGDTSATTIAKEKNMITLETNYGTIVFETYNNDAPKTVENFITLANKKFYDGLTFHRTIKGFMIQGGDPNGNGTGGPGYKFEDELNPQTASFKAGYKKRVVAMANSGPNTNGSQFFIMTADYPLPNNYTIFGKVVSGQDVVDTIANVKTGANDKPVTPVIIKKVVVK